MQSILDSERVAMSIAAKLVGVHVATLWRWTLSGVRGHRLPTVLVGGRRYVLKRDLDEFLAALNEGRCADNDSDDRQRRADEAGRRLDAMGVRNRQTEDRSSSTRK